MSQTLATNLYKQTVIKLNKDLKREQAAEKRIEDEKKKTEERAAAGNPRETFARGVWQAMDDGEQEKEKQQKGKGKGK